MPTIVTDGYRVYAAEVLDRFSEWTVESYVGRGRRPIPHKTPSKGLRYGQVVKTRNGRKLESVEYRSVFGNVPPSLLNTSCIERMNLTLRNGLARLKRAGITFSKDLEMLQYALDLFRAYYNLCLRHKSLEGSTPAISIGFTEHIWNMHELMTFSYRQNMHYKT